jgi:alpha 1,2-mannosyltransferase
MISFGSFSLGRTGPFRSFFLAVSIVFVILFTYTYWHPSGFSRQYFQNVQLSPEQSLLERQAGLWNALRPLLEAYSPDCPSPTRVGTSGAIGFNANENHVRPNLIKMSEEDKNKMKTAHSSFVDAITSSKELSLVHNPGTKGIVSTAGGTYMPVFLSSLRMLRRTGSKLPVELFLKDPSEYEKVVCEEVLPSLNARCLVLSDILTSGGLLKSKVEIAHYQLKSFAMLFSTFEDVLWIDADCFPLHMPDELFDSKLFKAKGMITWPDFWASTASPLYYEISQQPVPPMTLRASSETGELMISKKNHQLTLLLSAYYNFYGPSHYFTLLSQGAPGEGDKETFIQAASAVGEDFYTTSEKVGAIGHKKPDGGLSGSAMVQFDPIGDYALTTQGKWRVKDSSVAKSPRVFFIHAHYPKFNPATVFGYSWETTPTLKPDGSDGRAWLIPENIIQKFGYDAEKAYWEEIKWVACNLEGKLQTWKQKSGICSRVEKYWNNVFVIDADAAPKFNED